MRAGRLAWVGAAVAAAAAGMARARRFTYRDKVVLVTGGSRGLGFTLARHLVARGAQVALCARDEATLQRAAGRLAAWAPGRVISVPCELGDRDSVERAVADVRERLGPVDVLVNNAGLIHVAPMEDATLEDYEAEMRVHFWGPLYATLAVLPDMRRRRAGRIVNISSIGGKVAVPHLLPYAASKFALTGLSEGMRAELWRFGIKVTTVCPGLMRTGSPRNAAFKGRHRAEYAWFKLGDSLPLLSMSAERAARKILGAAARGAPEVILSVPAKLASLFHGILPGTTARLLSLVNLGLPRAGGIGTRAAAGRDSESRFSESMLNALTDRAAARNNEI